MSFEIITENPAWDARVRALPGADVFHGFAYVALEARRQQGRPVLVCASHGSAELACPLIIRDIPGASGLSDATSVYGYNGTLSRDVRPEDAGPLMAIVGNALAREHVVCVFNRGHPFGELELPASESIGETLALDLGAGVDAYERGLKDGHAYEIKRLRSEVVVRQDSGEEGLALFHQLYIQTMLRLAAAPAYLFTLDYLREVMSSAGPESSVELAWKGSQLAAACMILRGPSLAHYHLSASARGVTRHPATKLLIDHVVRDEMRAARRRWLHLGGGVGGAKDSLHAFKAGFGGQPRPYRVSRWVLRESDYLAICSSRGIQSSESYFPAYRR